MGLWSPPSTHSWRRRTRPPQVPPLIDACSTPPRRSCRRCTHGMTGRALDTRTPTAGGGRVDLPDRDGVGYAPWSWSRVSPGRRAAALRRRSAINSRKAGTSKASAASSAASVALHTGDPAAPKAARPTWAPSTAMTTVGMSARREARRVRASAGCEPEAAAGPRLRSPLGSGCTARPYDDQSTHARSRGARRTHRARVR